MNYRILALAAGLLTLTAPSLAHTASGSGPATVVYLVRHAEKVVPTPADAAAGAPLTTDGHARAQRLAKTLGDAGVDHVWSSDFERTLDTARPLAEKLGLEVELYDPRDLKAIAKRLRKTPGRHLVVGHSNTTPDLVGLLGGVPGEPIVEAWEYDRLYVVVLSPGRKTTTVQLRFGKASEPEAETP